MPALPRVALYLALSALSLLPASACTSGQLETAELGAGGGASDSLAEGGAAVGAAPDSAAGASPTFAGSGGASAPIGAGGATQAAGSASGTSAGGGAGTLATVCNDTAPNNGDTCAHAVTYGWCTQSWLGNSCQSSCGKCGSAAGVGGDGGSGGAGSSAAPGGNGGGAAAPGSPGQPPPLQGGTNGWATRYWDCCKPACGWKDNVPAGTNPVASCNASNQSFGADYDQQSACPNGNNGDAFMCQSFGPWAVSNTLAYGFAAVNKGSDYCGRCYQLQFTGSSHNSSNDTGSASLVGKTMIVQAINNGGVGGDQFDLLIPGGGVGDFNACTAQWGTSNLGEQYGGFFLACQKQNAFDYAKSKACAAAKCQSVFASKPDLLASCNWFVTWFGAPDNPALVYKEVTCPAAITALSGLHR